MLKRKFSRIQNFRQNLKIPRKKTYFFSVAWGLRMKEILQKKKLNVLRDLVPFVRFKKREKYPWRSVTFSTVEGLVKVTLLHGCFSRFLNCTKGTKLCKASQILYVLIMSRMRFRVNPHSIVASMSRTSLLETGAKSEV